MNTAREINHRSVTIRHTLVTDSACECSETLQRASNPSQSVTNPSQPFCDGFRRRKSISNSKFSLSSSNPSHCHTHPRATRDMRARGASDRFCDGFPVGPCSPRCRNPFSLLLEPKDWTMKVSCACCRYFSSKSAVRPRHECRRRSPAPRLGVDGRHDEFGLGVWPIVSPDGWCGEFKRQIVTRHVAGVGTNVRIPR